MGQFDIVGDPSQFFGIGQQIAGTSAMSKFVTDLTERAKNLDLLKAKTSFDVAGQVAAAGPVAQAKAQAEAQYDPSAQFFRQILGQDGGGGGAPGIPQAGGVDMFSRIAQVQQQLPTGLKLKLGDVGTLERPLQPQEKVQALQSAKTTLRSLDELQNLVDPSMGGDPGALLTKGFPGIKGARNVAGVFQNLLTEIVTSRGGKQLTPTEITLIKNNIPGRIDAVDFAMTKDFTNIQNRMDRLRVISQGLIAGLDPDAIGAQAARTQYEESTADQEAPSATPAQQGITIRRRIR